MAFHVNYINHNIDSPAVTQTASDDGYSFNQTSTSRNSANYGGYLTFNVASYSKFDLLELRQRLSAELDQIRDLRGRIDAGHLDAVENPRSQMEMKKFPGNKGPSAFVRSVPKKLFNGYADSALVAANFDALLKECGTIVGKLIKHKYGYVFQKPVDAAGLGLHDYHLIVKRPMDLGTVKANLAKKLYRTPIEFAGHTRLTFNNALLYNPKSDPVNGMAEQLLARFEVLFRPIQEKIDSSLERRVEMEVRDSRAINELQFRSFEELQGSSWNNQAVPSSARRKMIKPQASPVAEVLKKPDRTQTHSSASTDSNPPPPSSNQMPLIQESFPPSPVRDPPTLPMKEQKAERGRGMVKLPKPKAKDEHKRDMSMEEKQNLGMGLQSLPQEKMPQLVHIIRKRNQHLAQDGDEIELDIEALDTETLWELDRFVTNWKKMVSKTKRQALLNINTQANGTAVPPATLITDADMGVVSDKIDDDSGKKLKENDDEDVDIDDDMPATNFPPLEIEKDEGGAGGGGSQDHDDTVDASSSSSGSPSSDSSSSSAPLGATQMADDAQS
ncbi:hypothetical protein OROGR_031412 [Orobanche gracilis]